MRLSRELVIRKRSKLAIAVAASLMSMGFLGGCSDFTVNPLEMKSFLDPSELAGRSSKDVLYVKILDKIDPTIEEPNREFVTAQPPVQEDLAVNATDYVVSKNDMLSIEISDLSGPGTQTVKTSRVTESGSISLPFVGQVKAEGRTEYELEQDIVNAYKNAGILQRAQVSVSVVERRGAVFDVLGSVSQPGEYALVDPDTRVLNAITIARETTSTQLTDIYIIRRTDLNRAHSTTRPANTGDNTGPNTPKKTGGTDDLRPQGMLQLPGDTQRTAMLRDHAPRAAVASIRPAVTPRNGEQLPLLLADDAPAPGFSGGRDENGRYTIVDGKKIYITDTPESSPKPAARAPAPSSDLAPSAAPAGNEVPAPTPNPVPAPAPMPVPAPGVMPPAGGNGSDTFSGFKDLSAPENIRVIHIPLDRLRRGELQYNVVIRPKDVIIVQPLPVGTYYMEGHVGQAGAYSLTQSRVTLKQAVASARMLDSLAIPERTDIIRRIGPDKEVYVHVNLAKIFEGTAPDYYIKPDDQVVVGTNAVAPFLAAIRGAFRLTYGFGFLYDRNFAAEENNKIGR